MCRAFLHMCKMITIKFSVVDFGGCGLGRWWETIILMNGGLKCPLFLFRHRYFPCFRKINDGSSLCMCRCLLSRDSAYYFLKLISPLIYICLQVIFTESSALSGSVPINCKIDDLRIALVVSDIYCIHPQFISALILYSLLTGYPWRDWLRLQVHIYTKAMSNFGLHR